MKQLIRKFPLIHRWLHMIRGYIRPLNKIKIRDEIKMREEIDRTLQGRDKVFFVQVGSNDGSEGDLIHDLVVANPQWSGMFIEPVKFVFDRLRRDYQHAERFVFENVAISTESGSRKFYYIDEAAKGALAEDLPPWYDQLGSFDPNHIVTQLGGRLELAALEPYIVEEEVECVSLPEILARNSVDTIDLLHTDTEGFDYVILKQMEFDRYKPAVILYEHKHLSAEDTADAHRILESVGYTLTQYEWDTLAIQK